MEGSGRWKTPSRKGPAVLVKGATRSFGKVKALSSVDLKVKRGEMFGLIGPNGAGKSTLMKSLIGTIQLDSGSTRVLGMDPKTDGLSIKAAIGYVPESETPPSFLKIDEFLDFVMNSRGKPPNEKGKKKWIKFFDLDSYRETIAKDMSKGTRQKLMLSSAFIHKPSLMLLDEPFINLDPIYQRKVKDYLLEYVEKGGTVLLSTHILSLAEEICGRVAIINKGKELMMDTTDNIVDNYGSLENAFLQGVGYYK